MADEREVVLDACVLIGHLNRGDHQHERARALLSGIAARPLRISALTLAEVLVGPTRAGTGERAAGLVHDDLGVTARELSPSAAPRLAELRAHSGLTMPDCVVLCLAIDLAAEVATFDERLARAAHDRGLPVIDR